MRFGLFGGPARRSSDQTDSNAYRTVETVQHAERHGFYGTYLVEHHFTGRGQVSSSLGLLTYLAGLTSTIRLGTAVVVVPWHNPVLLAEQAATLDSSRTDGSTWGSDEVTAISNSTVSASDAAKRRRVSTKP